MKKEKRKKFLKRIGIIGVTIVVICFAWIFVCYQSVVSDYNKQIDNYNSLVPEYNEIMKTVEVTNIKDIPISIKGIDKITNNPWGYIKLLLKSELPNNIQNKRNELKKGIKDRLENVLVAEQITAPSETWIKERLSQVYFVTDIQSVTNENNPDGLLGKDGGYQSCTYFTILSLQDINIKGKDSVEKGTDGGGSIEVYDTLENAQNRVAYLTEFDNTLLNSGSYAIVGTMVIRLSYYLTDEQQLEFTNKITEKLTTIE